MKRNLIVMDIDDTILRSKDIFIERKLPSDDEIVYLTTAQYAEESITPETACYYSFAQFNDEQKIYDSIIHGEAILENLTVMDLYINNGFELVVLTARSNKNAVYGALCKFLAWRNFETNELEPVKFAGDCCYTVSDPAFSIFGDSTAERKANILKRLSDSNKMIVYLDDDHNNIMKVRTMDLWNVVALKVRGFFSKK